MPLCGCWAPAAPAWCGRHHHELRLERHVAYLSGSRVPPAPPALCHTGVTSLTGVTTPVADCPKSIRGYLSAKPPGSDVFATGKVAARHVGPPRHPSDGEVTWDAPAPSGTSLAVASDGEREPGRRT